MRRALRWAAGGVAGLLALAAAVLLLVDTDIGHRWVAERIDGVRTPTGLRFAVGRIDGSLYGDARLSDVRVYDLDGLLFQAPRVELGWRPWRWFANSLDVERLAIGEARLFHAPHTRPTGKHGPILPSFDIHVGRLSVDRLVLAPPVLGRERVGRLAGRADIRRGRALLDLAAVVEGSDRLRLTLDAEPDRDRFDIAVTARGGADGALAKLAGFRAPVALDVGGKGSWSRWAGAATGTLGASRVLDLKLAAEAGRYRLSGALAPSVVLHGKLQRLTTPRVLVDGTATLAGRRLDGALTLRSPALAAQVRGGLDLVAAAYRDLHVRLRLLQPPALFPNMTAEAMELRAILDGPMATARFDYRIDARRFAFDSTGFEDAHATGSGRLSPAPVRLPVRLTAARVTGIGEVAGGILRNLSVSGVLRVTALQITGDDLALRSDKLAGTIGLMVDLQNGRYQVGLNGVLGRYLIPGLGVVDVRSELHAAPGPGGHGTVVVGHGTAQMVRLDNAFFRSLTGGLPHIETGLQRTPDLVVHFVGLTLTSPALRLQGNGYRRRDGTFHFEGAGTQATYGPVQLVLDGKIDHPTLDLRFPLLNKTLGVRDVAAHLDPMPTGFAFRATGQSRLGPFVTGGSILLPSGGQASIMVAALDVMGTRASGQLLIVPGGFQGRLGVAGGGWRGELAFQPVAEVQRIEAHLDADGVRLGTGATTLRRGHLDLTTLLDPAGTRLEASATGAGLARGRLRLARFSGSAKLVGGTGEVRAAISGTRGRAFDIRTVAQVSPTGYAISADGTLDGRPIRLLEPARLTAEGDGFRLGPTRLTFAGGEAQVAGAFGGGRTSIDASLADVPLAVLDIGYPGLGLGGTASGTLSYAAAAGAAPTGRLNVTIRGLTRSGLVLTSRPVDVGLAGVLTADRLGLRAVAASGGKTVGRAQALLTPLGGGDLATRIANAPLVAQLRYAGPADTLWRLTGVELFDLSGPVAIGADVSGRLSQPVIRGSVQAQGARIESATTGTVLTDVAASGRFGGSRLVIDRFAAAAGRDGKVSGTGQFDFAAAHGIGLDLKLQAEHAVMINRDDIGATVSGQLAFRSDGRGGVISGDVTLDRSRYRLGQATAATAAPQLNVREINLPGGGEEDEAPPAPWTLALRARAPNGLIVSGLGLSSEWSADLQIGGAPDNPAIGGRATLIRGDYEFAGREFRLERGTIRFDGSAPANPALDIAADADTTGLSATIRVTGTGLKPEISFTSVPALPEDELLSRLLFGTSITNLSAPEALQLAAAVAALQNGGNGLNPINAVRRAAGLDRLRILPADPQTGQGTSIAAGKYVTRRLYAEIVTDGQGYSATQVEFQVTRWLSLLSSISTLGRTSGNVRVSKDY